MATNVLIIGESGTGKSTSIRNLDPKETFIINVLNKPLPFKGWRKGYYDKDKKDKKESEPTRVNYFATRSFEKVQKSIKKINEEIPHIKTIIIDDFQYIMAMEFMDRATEKGYSKFTEIAKHVTDIIDEAMYTREDLKVIFLAHSESSDEGVTKLKTIGRLLSEKITIEGMFTIVFISLIKDGEYCFATQNDGKTVAKSPMDMFENRYIPNDLKYIIDKINEYYDEDIPF